MPKQPPVAVVDTNVLVSGLLNPDGPPGAVLAAIVKGELIASVSREVLAEYESVLNRPRFGFHPPDVAKLLALIGQQARWVEVPQYPTELKLPDPSDWPFIGCALALGCLMITGNTKHFPARAGVRVMTAREWVVNPVPGAN